MKNVKIIIEYDGTDYHGWQCQANLPTVQKTIEDALRQITGENVKITGSGRTDAGVHAIGQVANFFIETRMDPETLRKALNSTLPRDISIIKAQEVPDGFHAQFSSRSKDIRIQDFQQAASPRASEKQSVAHPREA